MNQERFIMNKQQKIATIASFTKIKQRIDGGFDEEKLLRLMCVGYKRRVGDMSLDNKDIIDLYNKTIKNLEDLPMDI